MFKNRFAVLATASVVFIISGCVKPTDDPKEGSGPLSDAGARNQSDAGNQSPTDASIQNPGGDKTSYSACLNGPNGWCWLLYKNFPGNSTVWVAPPSATSAHALLASVPESVSVGKAGMGFLTTATVGRELDLRSFDRVVFQATASSSFEFNLATSDATAGCSATFQGSGTQQTYVFSFATCSRWAKTATQPAFDFSSVGGIDWATPWGTVTNLNIELVPDILFCRGTECTANPLLPPKTNMPDTGISSSPPDTAAAGGTGGRDAASTSTTSSVTFANGKPSGAMNGWAWPTMGQDEVITDPRCQPNLVPPTMAAPCNSGVKWNSPTQLCLSGSTPAAVSELDYSQSWGMGIAVSVGETEGTPLGRSHSTMAFLVSGIPANVLSRGRFVVGVHRAGDPAGTMYLIANDGLGQPIRLTDMNTAWWNTSQGIFLQPADVPKIDRVEIDVMADSVPFTVSNLCLSGIVFGNESGPDGGQTTNPGARDAGVEAPSVDGGTGEGCVPHFDVQAGGYVSTCTWKGYAWTSAPGTGVTIAPSDFSSAAAGSRLCAIGEVPPIWDFNNTAILGINLNQSQSQPEAKGSYTPTGAGLRYSLENTGGTPLYFLLKGTSSSWCNYVKEPSGVIPWARFTTKCWNPWSGPSYDGVTPLTELMVVVPSDDNATYSYNFCINDLEDEQAAVPADVACSNTPKNTSGFPTCPPGEQCCPSGQSCQVGTYCARCTSCTESFISDSCSSAQYPGYRRTGVTNSCEPNAKVHAHCSDPGYENACTGTCNGHKVVWFCVKPATCVDACATSCSDGTSNYFVNTNPCP